MTADDDLVERLGEHAVPVEKASPGAGHADLRQVATVLDGKQVVGLGEATHGTREFFQLKHRLVRLLVTELDFRLFGLEANFSEALAIDDYVVSGEGNPEEALAGLGFWTWNTEEVLALVEWLREYNEGRPDAEKVRFYGCDAQFTRGPATAIEAFFERVDPDYLEEIRDNLKTLLGRPSRTDHDARKEWLVAAETVVRDVGARLERHGDSYRAETTEREWRLLGRHHRVLEQAFELAVARTFEDEPSPNGVRDANMAENARWIMDHENADRIALWAHNGHVKTGSFEERDDEATPKTMGHHLRTAFGDDYYALGFEFGRGSFQARPNPETAAELEVQSFSLDSVHDDTAAAVLNQLDYPRYFLDIESAVKDATVYEWLGRSQSIHNIGSVYSADVAEVYTPVELQTEFDGLMFVQETSRAVPIDGT